MKDGRNIEDAKTNVSKAFPAAGAAAYTDSIDLVAASYVGDVEAVIASPALANLANTKTANLFVQESAEESANFANIGGLSLTVTGGASGAAAATQRVRFPAGTKRYIRLGVAVEANGGDNTDSQAEIRLKY
jgi:hypothetical protein